MKHFKHIGELLLKKRNDAHFTQKDIANIMEVNAQLISNIERGIQSIPPARQKKVCKILDISRNEIYAAKKADFLESFDWSFDLEWAENEAKNKKTKGRKK